MEWDSRYPGWGEMALWEQQLFGIVLKPVGAYFVGEVADGEVGEGDVEAVAVRACGHHTDFDRTVGFHPGVTHQSVFLIIE